SVTPVVLPEAPRGGAKAGRPVAPVVETARARRTVVQALHHAGIHVPVESIRLQREPFHASEARVEAFPETTRFETECLWHVEVVFSAPLKGPLLVGDGRFIGLGLMAPALDIVPGIHTYSIVDEIGGQPDSL